MRNLVAVLAVVIFGAAVFQPGTTAQAITGWNAGRIIDDSVFTANGAMSASQIQSFLAAKVPSCDTNGSKISEYGGPDLNGDGKVQRWEWGKAKYNQTKFICLKNYVSGDKKASQIIYEKAQKYKISPRVLIVLLQKEQGLVTDTWPLNVQYRTATGYGCPDTAPCDSQYYGLANQIDWAAKMFRAIMDNLPTWYTPYELGENYIQYNPSASCGGSIVNIQNRATQALYNYTPYQPNKAALNAGWGSTSCGAYGNRNFFLYFSNWFGQPNATAKYDYSLVSREIFSDAGYTNQIGANTATVTPGSLLYARVKVKNTGNQVWYKEFMRLGTEEPRDRLSEMATSEWINQRRPAAMLEDSVAAGQTATFLFPLKAPSKIGSFVERFGAVIEGQRWLNGTFAFGVSTASSEDYYAIESATFKVFHDAEHHHAITSTANIYPGSKIYVKATVKNVGNRTWPANITRVGTTYERDRSSVFQNESWFSDRRAGVLPNDIPAGSVGTFMFSMTAPATNETYLEQFGLVVDGTKWVSYDLGKISISVSDRPSNELAKSEHLTEGGTLAPGNDLYKLSLQDDGNLVLRTYLGKALWNTRTNGKRGSKLILQNDGNLVLYSSDDKALWNTRTNGKRGSKLILQNDGNLVLYSSDGKALWNTRTNGKL